MAAPSAPPTPPYLDMSVLPERLRYNWYIFLTVRSTAQVRHAQRFANAVAGKQESPVDDRWVAAFDHAFIDWLGKNPMAEWWASGFFPEGAADYLGADALKEACALLGLD